MIVSCNSIHQMYKQGEDVLYILKGVSLSLKSGEIIALLGSSGSGKSTLLHAIGLLEAPSSGSITIDGHEMTFSGKSQNHDLTAIRRTTIGFIYQFHHLLPEFTALENVMLPLILAGVSKKNAHNKAVSALNKMKLSHRIHHMPTKLSGGEQQRVAIARALIHDPKVLLADEPTGNLDNETAAIVFDELMTLIRTQKLGAIIATHDLALASKMDRIVRLTNGILEPVEKSA